MYIVSTAHIGKRVCEFPGIAIADLCSVGTSPLAYRIRISSGASCTILHGLSSMGNRRTQFDALYYDVVGRHARRKYFTN